MLHDPPDEIRASPDMLPGSELLTLIDTKNLTRGSEEKSLIESYVPGVTKSVLHMLVKFNIRFIHLLSKQLFHLPGKGV